MAPASARSLPNLWQTGMEVPAAGFSRSHFKQHVGVCGALRLSTHLGRKGRLLGMELFLRGR